MSETAETSEILRKDIRTPAAYSYLLNHQTFHHKMLENSEKSAVQHSRRVQTLSKIQSDQEMLKTLTFENLHHVFVLFFLESEVNN